MALIGEAGCIADFCQRRVRIEQAFASGADAEAMDMVANTFTDAAAKNAREVYGMDAGFACQLVEGEPAAMFGAYFVENTGEPARGAPAFLLRATRGEREYFGEQAFDGEIVRGAGSLCFVEEFHTQPEQRAAPDVVSGSVQSGGAIRETFLPRGADLDFVKANATRPDFVLMGSTRRAEHKTERSILALAPAAAFTV